MSTRCSFTVREKLLFSTKNKTQNTYRMLFYTETTRESTLKALYTLLKREKFRVGFILRYKEHPGYIKSILTRFNDSSFVSRYLLHVVHPCPFGSNMPEQLPRTTLSPNPVNHYVQPLLFFLLAFVSPRLYPS